MKKESNQAEIGARIRACRSRRHYTREDLAGLAGLSVQFLYEVESGAKGLSADSMLRISKALLVSCEYLMTGAAISEEDNGLQALNAAIQILTSFTPHQRQYATDILRTLQLAFRDNEA